MKIASKKSQAESLSLACADASNHSSCDSPEKLLAIKKNALEQRKLAAFTRELVIIKAQCDAGLEPAISIAGTCFLSKRSHATVYRDIQKRILPAPIKIGRNSALPFAVVKAYAAGQLVGVAA
jgi:predicted DNA-binding transcriptional regulator AlpA